MKNFIRRSGMLLLAALLLFPLQIMVSAFDEAGDNKNELLRPFAAGENVRLQETGDLFDTLYEALTEASGIGLETVTLEVIGPVTETNSPLIQANMNVTLLGAEGEHTVTLAASTTNIRVQNGGSLTLGDGTKENPLTIDAPSTAVYVTNGTVSIEDGIILIGDSPNSGTVEWNGPNATGSISGGIIKGYRAAVGVVSGARLSEISGGTFTGVEAAVYLTGDDTKIELISGGVFLQEDPLVVREGIALFVQNGSLVGEISGGYFESARLAAIVIVRGGWIDRISGGEFVATRVLSGPTNMGRTAAVHIQGEGYPGTGIGTISGGLFQGGYFGILLIMEYSRIDAIIGGTFLGIVALQNDQKGVVHEISGGTFLGSNYGILNVNLIEEIGGAVEIRGILSFGIYNHPLTGSRINEISGGLIVSDADHGIQNTGTIGLISGGTIIGELSAINCVSPAGEIGTITNGVFWGKNDVAIHLEVPLLLEPGLNAERGLGRYWGRDGVIFNDDALVVFPDNYHMSAATVQVDGIVGVGFRFLRLPVTFETVIFTAGPGGTITGAVAVEVPHGESLTADQIPTPVPASGHVFAGWFLNGQRLPDILALTVTAPLTLEARFTIGNPGGPEEPKPTPEERQAYLIGTPGGLIRPNDNMTRAEAATIFFRLISDDARGQYWSRENPFRDVEINDWFHKAVSTTTNMGLFRGTTSDTFAPGDAITRGDLAAVIVRFMDALDEPVPAEDQFSDIADHWARAYINRATANGWIRGDAGLGGAFRPADSITRAEVAAMINRMFKRLPETAADLLPDMITWPDNADPDSWYYLYLQSASNSYTYERKADGMHERWLTIIPSRNWLLLERPDSMPGESLR